MIPNGALYHFGGGDQQFVARVGVQRFELFELIREPLEPLIVLVLFIAHAADGIATSRFLKGTITSAVLNAALTTRYGNGTLVDVTQAPDA
jgi:hypothetical protein